MQAIEGDGNGLRGSEYNSSFRFPPPSAYGDIVSKCKNDTSGEYSSVDQRNQNFDTTKVDEKLSVNWENVASNRRLILLKEKQNKDRYDESREDLREAACRDIMCRIGLKRTHTVLILANSYEDAKIGLMKLGICGGEPAVEALLDLCEFKNGNGGAIWSDLLAYLRSFRPHPTEYQAAFRLPPRSDYRMDMIAARFQDAMRMEAQLEQKRAEVYNTLLSEIRREITQQFGLDQMHRAFIKCDLDRSGFLDRKELKKMLLLRNMTATPAAMDALLDCCDTNESGGICFNEFVKAITGVSSAEQSPEEDDVSSKIVEDAMRRLGTSDIGMARHAKRLLFRVRDEVSRRFGVEQLRKAFQRLDGDRSGFLDREELWLMFQRLNLRVGPAAVEALFHLIDENGDGRIAFNEFARALVPREEKARQNEYVLEGRRAVPGQEFNRQWRVRGVGPHQKISYVAPIGSSEPNSQMVRGF